jgi:SnoaL-like domain
MQSQSTSATGLCSLTASRIRCTPITPRTGWRPPTSLGTIVDIVRSAVSGYTATQHLSANHVTDFDRDDPDRATCHSSMYAQHHLADGDELLILRGWYANHLVRVPTGWKIDRIVQHVSWREVTRP